MGRSLMRIDLDAARTARLEAKKERHSLVYGGEEFVLPPELPAEFGFLVAFDGDTRKALEFLLQDDYPRFWEKRPSKEDLEELVGGIARAYGFVSMGESSASPGSSSNGGSRSRPTSPATTGSTSEKRATAKAS